MTISTFLKTIVLLSAVISTAILCDFVSYGWISSINVPKSAEICFFAALYAASAFLIYHTGFDKSK